MATRCKFICNGVEKNYAGIWNKDTGKYEQGFSYNAKFNVVGDGTPEDKEFFASTPTGEIQVRYMRDGVFVPGAKYYVDFTEVTEEGR